jgi:hypothetical protein
MEVNMNRRVLSAWIAGALLICAHPARSQSLGQFGGASPLPMNGHTLGTFVDASSHEVGFITQLRLSYYPDVDFGFQGGLKRLDYVDTDGNALRLGADFKVAARRVRSGFPVDLSFGAGLGVDTGDNLSVLTMGPNAIASRAYPAGNGTIEPYAALGLCYASINTSAQDDTGIQWPLRLGAEYRFTPDLRFAMELKQSFGTHHGDRNAFAIGTTFGF